MLHDLTALRAAAVKIAKKVNATNVRATVGTMFDDKEVDEQSFTARLLAYYAAAFPVLTPEIIKAIKKENADVGIVSDSKDAKLAYRYRKYSEMLSGTGFYGYWKQIGSAAFDAFVVKVSDECLPYNDTIKLVRTETKSAAAAEKSAGAANDAELTARVAGINDEDQIKALRDAAAARATGEAFDAAAEAKASLGSCVKSLLKLRDCDAQVVLGLLQASFRSARSTQIDADHDAAIKVNGAYEKLEDMEPAERTGTN